MIIIETIRTNSDQALFQFYYIHAVHNTNGYFDESKLHVCNKL